MRMFALALFCIAAPAGIASADIAARQDLDLRRALPRAPALPVAPPAGVPVLMTAPLPAIRFDMFPLLRTGFGDSDLRVAVTAPAWMPGPVSAELRVDGMLMSHSELPRATSVVLRALVAHAGRGHEVVARAWLRHPQKPPILLAEERFLVLLPGR